MKRTKRIIRSMDGPIRFMGHLNRELCAALDKTANDLQEEFPIVSTGVEDSHPHPILPLEGEGAADKDSSIDEDFTRICRTCRGA